jgi:hypothetical protein
MPTNNTEIKKREDFMLSGSLSEMAWEPRTEAQISRDLFKGTDPEKIVDAFESQTGLLVKNIIPTNQVYKNVFLSPCTDEEDAQLLCKFYNNPEQYQVINRSDNWTPRGELKIFLEYFENLDVRINKEQEQ